MRLASIGLTFLTLLTAFVETPNSLNLIAPLGVPQALAQTPVNRQFETNRLVAQGIKQTQISQVPPTPPQETRVSQCNKIIEIANEAVSNAKTFTSNSNSSDPAAMLRAAEAMADAAETMKNVSISDPILQNFRARFILMYQNTSQATRDFVRAFETKNRAEAEAALQILQAATSPEKQLVDEINNYCTSNGRSTEAYRLLEQGNQQLNSGEFQAAIQSFQQAVTIYREINDRQEEEGALIYLGSAYHAQEDYAKAIEYYEQSLAIAREINDRQGEGWILNFLGSAYHAQEDYAKAIEYYEQSLAIAHEINDRELEKLVQEGLSLVQNQSNFGKAYTN